MLGPIETLAVAGAQRFVEHLAERAAGGVAARPTQNRIQPIEPIENAGTTVREDRIRHAIREHLISLDKWSSQVQMYGMARPESIGDGTIPLDFAEIPRRFRSAGTDDSRSHEMKERDLLRPGQGYVLLGDPGAGKTTTVKRLARHLLLEPSLTTPIVAVLRRHSRTKSVARIVVDELGLKEEFLEANDHGGFHEPPGFDQSVAVMLNSLQAVLFLDGLDEVHQEVRFQLEASIDRLGLLLSDAKMVVSCRSGDYGRLFEGFSTAEICSLLPNQIADVSRLWLHDRAKAFMDQLSSEVPSNLSNRPLFLCQMLVLFRNTESLPDQPSALCRQIVRLMLQDWDQQRGVVRQSKYSRFGVDSKLEFLTALAYTVTYGLALQSFDHARLVQAYQSLWKKFGLPQDEAEQVAREIETHTGVVVQVGYSGFEFSHLSIQEYLAAEYVVRLPKQVVGLYERSPATMAVATALSSDPSGFLARLIPKPPGNLERQPFRSFITRLLQERPRFDGGDQLGAATLNMMLNYHDSDEGPLLEFIQYPGVAEAAGRALNAYTQVGNQNPQGRVHVTRSSTSAYLGLHQQAAVELPYMGSISEHVLQSLWDVLVKRYGTSSGYTAR